MNTITAATTTTTSVTKMGWKLHTQKIGEIIADEVQRALAQGDFEPTPAFFASMVTCQAALNLIPHIDHDLYIAEYVEMCRENLVAMGLDTREGAEAIVETSKVQIDAAIGKDAASEAYQAYGVLTEKCYDALFASYN